MKITSSSRMQSLADSQALLDEETRHPLQAAFSLGPDQGTTFPLKDKACFYDLAH